MKSKNKYAIINYNRNVNSINILKDVYIDFNHNKQSNQIDDYVYKTEILNVGGGCIWKDGLMVMAITHPNQIEQFDKFGGFEEVVRINLGLWDTPIKYLKWYAEIISSTDAEKLFGLDAENKNAVKALNDPIKMKACINHLMETRIEFKKMVSNYSTGTKKHEVLKQSIDDIKHIINSVNDIMYD